MSDKAPTETERAIAQIESELKRDWSIRDYPKDYAVYDFKLSPQVLDLSITALKVQGDAELKVKKAVARYRDYIFDDFYGGYKHTLEEIIKILEGEV